MNNGEQRTGCPNFPAIEVSLVLYQNYGLVLSFLNVTGIPYCLFLKKMMDSDKSYPEEKSAQ